MNWTHLYAASLLNRHHERGCAGFYGGGRQHGGRWFGARTDRGEFEATPDFGRSWVVIDLAEASFWTGEGRSLCIYPPRQVLVKLSSTMCFEYDTRGVFGPDDPEWPEVPAKPGRMTLPWSTAVAMLDDAEFNGDSRHGPEEMPPGSRQAYRALAKQLRRAMSLPSADAPAVPDWCRPPQT